MKMNPLYSRFVTNNIGSDPVYKTVDMVYRKGKANRDESALEININGGTNIRIGHQHTTKESVVSRRVISELEAKCEAVLRHSVIWIMGMAEMVDTVRTKTIRELQSERPIVRYNQHKPSPN